jgi:hypothetical protein
MPDPLDVFDLFIERFPCYALSLPEWLRRPKKEYKEDPQWIFKEDLEQIDILYLYGMGDGSKVNHFDFWLKKKAARRLIFLEPDPGRIVNFLKKPFAKKILDQPQIEIFHLPTYQEKSRLLDDLSERYPFCATLIAEGPGLLPEMRKGFRQTRLQLLRKSALANAVFIDRFYSHIPLANLLDNLRRLPSAFYVNRMKDAFQGIPAVICGAGPSLDDAIEILRGLKNRAILIAGGSTIAALSSHGITPHFAVAMDPNPSEMLRLKNSFAFETPFCFSTRLFPGSFAACNGPFGYIRSGTTGMAELWFEEQLGLIEPLMSADLSSESLSVTTLCVALAHHFGCDPIVFAGLDLAYTQNRRYADGVNASQIKEEEILLPGDRLLAKRDRRGVRVQSAVRWVMEASAISKFTKRHKERRWINCTTQGLAIQGVEIGSLEVVSQSFSTQYDLQGRIHQAISESPMPADCQSILTKKIKELCQSLDAVLSHLDVLVRNQHPGRCAIAEIEIREELAFGILFYDIEKTLRKEDQDSNIYWRAFQRMARECRKSFFINIEA